MTDRDVLFDVLKLSFSFLDRDQSGTSAPERARVEAFLRLFVPLLFGVPHSDMEANLAHSDETPDVEEDEVESELEGGTSDGESSAFGGGQRNGINKKGGAADLRKRLLTHAATTAARGGAIRSASRANSPVGGEDGVVPAVGVLGEQTWIQLNAAKEGDMVDDEPLPPRRFNFFANATFYCLVRIIHVRSLRSCAQSARLTLLWDRRRSTTASPTSSSSARSKLPTTSVVSVLSASNSVSRCPSQSSTRVTTPPSTTTSTPSTSPRSCSTATSISRRTRST